MFPTVVFHGIISCVARFGCHTIRGNFGMHESMSVVSCRPINKSSKNLLHLTITK